MLNISTGGKMEQREYSAAPWDQVFLNDALLPGVVLTNQERRGLIFALRANGATFSEISALCGISASRVAKIDAQTEERLAHALRIRIRERTRPIVSRQGSEVRIGAPRWLQGAMTDHIKTCGEMEVAHLSEMAVVDLIKVATGWPVPFDTLSIAARYLNLPANLGLPR
jgi:hypothetical protein